MKRGKKKHTIIYLFQALIFNNNIRTQKYTILYGNFFIAENKMKKKTKKIIQQNIVTLI